MWAQFLHNTHGGEVNLKTKLVNNGLGNIFSFFETIIENKIRMNEEAPNKIRFYFYCFLVFGKLSLHVILKLRASNIKFSHLSMNLITYNVEKGEKPTKNNVSI